MGWFSEDGLLNIFCVLIKKSLRKRRKALSQHTQPGKKTDRYQHQQIDMMAVTPVADGRHPRPHRGHFFRCPTVTVPPHGSPSLEVRSQPSACVYLVSLFTLPFLGMIVIAARETWARRCPGPGHGQKSVCFFSYDNLTYTGL